MITIYEVHKCGAGCGRVLADPGLCPRCEEEVAALNRTYFADGPRDREIAQPQLPEWVYRAGAALAVLLAGYILTTFFAGGF